MFLQFLDLIRGLLKQGLQLLDTVSESGDLLCHSRPYRFLQLTVITHDPLRIEPPLQLDELLAQREQGIAVQTREPCPAGRVSMIKPPGPSAAPGPLRS